MRTRSTSLSEKYAIYGGIIGAILISLLGAFITYRSYSTKISELKARKEEMASKENQLSQELSKVKAQIQGLNAQLKDKQSKISQEKADFEKKKKEIGEIIQKIPPIYMKSLLRKSILEKAKLLNIDVLKYSAREVTPEEFSNLDFFPLEFSMEIAGEYASIKKLISYLDTVMELKDVKDESRQWRFIVTIPREGGLTLVDPNTRFYGPAIPNAGPAPAAGGPNQGTQEIKLDTLELNTFTTYREGLLMDDKLEVKLILITYFRKDT
ncbi:MAG: hypothetical protein PHW04_04925 [Candidatus Wallbacteria bacterium]|nr:hypothetical protein [Candidatus Wallbacteria bacterium]